MLQAIFLHRLRHVKYILPWSVQATIAVSGRLMDLTHRVSIQTNDEIDLNVFR